MNQTITIIVKRWNEIHSIDVQMLDSVFSIFEKLNISEPYNYSISFNHQIILGVLSFKFYNIKENDEFLILPNIKIHSKPAIRSERHYPSLEKIMETINFFELENNDENRQRVCQAFLKPKQTCDASCILDRRLWKIEGNKNAYRKCIRLFQERTNHQ